MVCFLIAKMCFGNRFQRTASEGMPVRRHIMLALRKETSNIEEMNGQVDETKLA